MSKVRIRNFTMMLGSMLFVLTGVGISPALPGMSDYFHHLPDSEFLVKLTLTIPALIIAVTAPFAGILLDKWGRRPVILLSLILYGVAGSSGYWMESLSGILIGRAFLGLATAGLMSGIITLIGDLYEGEQLNRFMGYQSAALGIGGLIFLLLAGVLADISWRFPFLIHLHAFVVIPGVLLAVKEPNIDREKITEIPLNVKVPFPWKLTLIINTISFSAMLLILPGMGVASEILSVFSRKPIFGYKAMVFAMLSIAGLGFIVWGHHMFQSGMNPALGMTFMFSTMVIAVPSAIKTFNWLGTLKGGNIKFTVPMLNALAFVSMFVIGGLSGMYMASTPVDIFIHDTYFIVAHIHYVVFGGSIFGMFAGIYYWFPKMFGRSMNMTLGKIHFWFTIIFFNATFFPMHILGIGGHMRRIYNPMQYEFLQDMQWMNEFITVSAFLLGSAQLLFIYNFFYSMYKGKAAQDNPWEANTLEWTAPTPPPHGNFLTPPIVYRGPYEYSVPDRDKDWYSQSEK